MSMNSIDAVNGSTGREIWTLDVLHVFLIEIEGIECPFSLVLDSRLRAGE
jgi:hypothetical protein